MESRLFKNIILATDGSKYSTNAVEYAVELAKISGAGITAMSVVDTGAFATIPMDAAWENIYELLKTEANEATGKVEAEAKKSDVEVKCFVVEGHPAEEIVKLSETIPADLIVMGTLGKRGLDRFLLGSVAEKVSRTSKVPVMIVRGEKPR
ncbi:MAG TPA: universal stress protein [Methanosarcinales archaeon]|nr:universal stress protein [Methanosarcinales archaeon]